MLHKPAVARVAKSQAWIINMSVLFPLHPLRSSGNLPQFFLSFIDFAILVPLGSSTTYQSPCYIHYSLDKNYWWGNFFLTRPWSDTGMRTVLFLPVSFTPHWVDLLRDDETAVACFYLVSRILGKFSPWYREFYWSLSPASAEELWAPSCRARSQLAGYGQGRAEKLNYAIHLFSCFIRQRSRWILPSDQLSPN